MNNTFSTEEGSIKKVVIVGGSIAGLTLAHALCHLGIEFTVLEKHGEISSSVGANICILGNGARILDQLGVWDDILQRTIPVDSQRVWREDGRLVGETDALKLLPIRQGYPLVFIERRELLQVLFDHLKDRRKDVLVSKYVTCIEHLPVGIVAYCADGSSVAGDLVVGADGVRSVVREEMWRHMTVAGLGSSTEKDRKCIRAEYCCVFGISSPTPGLYQRQVNRTIDDGIFFFGALGKDDQVFWFLCFHMGDVYHGSDIPKFDEAQRESLLESALDKCVGEGVCFDKLYKNTIRSALVPLEEGVYRYWNWGRMVCIGDSSHKTAPNLGQGGNAAIEDAASLANEIDKLRSPTSTTAMHETLQLWSNKRKKRVTPICHAGEAVTRMEMFKNWAYKILGLYLAVRHSSALADILCDASIGAESLSFLPLPPKSNRGTMPFDRSKGLGAPGTMLKRTAWAFPFLLLSFISCWGGVYDVALTSSQSLVHSDMQKGVSYQYIANYAVIMIIWTVEGFRGGNRLSLASWPLPFAILAHWQHARELAVPLYFGLYYLLQRGSRLLVPDCRIVCLPYIKALVPALVAGHFLPAASIFQEDSPEFFRDLHLPLPLLPIMFSGVLWMVSLCFRDTTSAARLHAPTTDLNYIRFACSFIAAIAGYHSFHSWWLTGLLPGKLLTLSQPGGLAISSGLIWLMLEIKDLKVLGQISVSWVVMMLCMPVATVLLGPSTALILGWGFREEVLARSLQG
ncbi:hypothetical protein BDV25DRAFT_135585 [Aspergillus avenaceus]|uniref:FAD-binding domain-containing protein n=1 Tax=Aspergillus avenaceus TaxID=36643 RepID=A0A5N6U7U6_ASPAV|nr:hypothetical protein BDV25DRAFT_135585 [Aspergillus avenaceus]